MENNAQEIERISFETLLSIIFIMTSLLNILGNKFHLEYLITSNNEKEKISKDIYVLVLIITIIIYYYFINRDYRFLISAKDNNGNIKHAFLRLLGSVFLMIGVLLILYVLIDSNELSGEVEI